jgi:hypothetical protein
LTIFKKCEDRIARQAIARAKGGELAVRKPRHASSQGADPKRSVMPYQQLLDIVAQEAGGVSFVKDGERNAIETDQSFFCSEPNISIRRLRYGKY